MNGAQQESDPRALLEQLRNRLLSLTTRNRLVNFGHGRLLFVRVIDELPDQLCGRLNSSKLFFAPLREPSRDDLVKHRLLDPEQGFSEDWSMPTPATWAGCLGLNASFELPLPTEKAKKESKHEDDIIQTLLYPAALEAKLRKLRLQANTAVEETGANFLCLAFGFLSWYESPSSDKERHSPL